MSHARGRGHQVHDWIEKWGKVPDSESARDGWAHHGIVVSETGKVIAFHQADPTVLIFDEEGDLENSWTATVENAHGMYITKEGTDEYLWLADNISSQAVKTALEGELVLSVDRPDLKVYVEGGAYKPTGVAVNQEKDGGNGDVYVADGYGSSYVHRYDKNGEYIDSINGEESEAGRFATPHDVWVDTRKPEKELYIADRANGRLQVYDLEGNYKRVFGRAPAADWLHSPAAFAQTGDFLIVAELRGSRITVLDKDDELVCYLGENAGAFRMNPGWPNVPHETLIPGKCSSPHGIAADPDGNIYSAEWLIGGRINKLAKVV
ncbi:MAG: 6-bladed beta-propeller [SAR202 cluster bacterium]|nr:6-bladed beta-propeller [SAR202 cluster bacterium]